MTPQINAVLDEIRLRLENAFGPETASSGSDAHASGEAGEGEAENVTDVEDALDLYLNAMISKLEADYDFEEDDAIGLVFDVIDELGEEGLLPPFPEDEATEQMLATWMGKAKSVGLQARVIEAAIEMSA
jgi:hypothetical protein